MNSLLKQNSKISLDDFSDSDSSDTSNQLFIPQGKNLLHEISKTQFGFSQNDTLTKEAQNSTQKQTSSKIVKGQNMTKEFLMDCILRNKSSKENKEKSSSQSDNKKQQASLKWLSNEKKVQKVTKINKKNKTKISKNIFKTEQSYHKAKLEELFEQRLKIDNPRGSANLKKNKFREKRIQQSTQKNAGKMMIQQMIYNHNNTEKIIFEQTKKICINNQLSPEDIIDAFIFNIFKLQTNDQQKIILALKYYLNNMMYADSNIDYYEIARIQVFKRLLKLLDGDSYGYHHNRNQNLLIKFFEMKIINLEDVKSLILYLFYSSTRYLTEQLYSKAEFYLDLTDIFYSAFYDQLNQVRQFCCDIYRCDAQINLLEMYIKNCDNIQYFQANGSVFMKNFDMLSQNEHSNIPIFLIKVLKIYEQSIKQQNRVPKILSTIQTLIRVMQKN